MVSDGGGLFRVTADEEVTGYSDFKNSFHTNPNCGVLRAPPNSVGIPLSFGGVIYSTYPWLQYCPYVT